MRRDPTMKIVTPLDDDLLFHRMTAREELGRLSEFEIDLLSARNDIAADEILGKNVTVKLELETEGFRYFNGFVTRFSQTGMRGRYNTYQASVRPWLWFLTRTADCRIFQKKSIPDIIEEVFADHAVADYELDLKGQYSPWEYCVQYRETDFNFVSRLMEQEGMYYYFRHAEGRHTMVITDSISGHGPFAGYETLPYQPLDRVRPEKEAVTRWTFGYEVQPGSYATNDYNFKEPRVDRNANREEPKQNELGTYEVYDYPGEYDDRGEGLHVAVTRIEELHVQYELAHATTISRGLACGCTFKLKGFPRGDQNREYLVTSATHQCEYSDYEAMEAGGTDYGCSFTALNTPTPFRPARITPKPVVQGLQTAFVVGPSGDEIHTDEYGRIKVQFHWDRVGEEDENSSCWIRVAQVWAGKNWGANFIPRIGQEVLVSFLEGDPDQPLVTGSVYNALQKHPYLGQGLDGKHKHDPNVSGIKTNSTKGGVGYNELRFDDTKDREQIFIHGEKNYDVRVKNDMMERVLHDRHTIVGGKDGGTEGDHRIQIYQDRHKEVKRHEIIKIAENREELVGGNYDHIVKGAHKEQIDGDQHLTIKGKKAEKVTGKVSLTTDADLHQKVAMNTALDSGMAIHLKAGMTCVIEAGMQLSLKVGGNFIDIGPAGVTIQGTMVLINSGGAAGSGSGCSADAPEAPKEAAPTEPTQADDSASGSKSCE
ncbi:MAG TPA: type VI secretion system tip protein TssI/VgrG [Burkholderiales bacterium]|nr:type VI secretion system tip protein TssI/VgrG [Burkholderiales bacterium]